MLKQTACLPPSDKTDSIYPSRLAATTHITSKGVPIGGHCRPACASPHYRDAAKPVNLRHIRHITAARQSVNNPVRLISRGTFQMHDIFLDNQ
ncbi:unnamed protein product [Soboliphyme baturini]|uniref:CRIB domain-containing protein n=1 Tax=Soboliphyme baturini TaxID=241478 RepID=A0A183IE82_9BILA|nr:unnamed protein product [Soboliphyme baturini]